MLQPFDPRSQSQPHNFMKQFITSLLSADGSVSSMRVITLVWTFAVLGVWVYKNTVNGPWSMDETMAWITGGVLFGKVAQSAVESKTATPPAK